MKPIVSGGRTGAESAGLNWANKNGVPHGGYCPRGKLAEDGATPERYNLAESNSRSYPGKTERNAKESCGTIIFTIGEKLSGDSRLTATCAQKHGKPCLHVWAGAPREITVATVQSFVIDNHIAVLNVAGSRGSKEPEVAAFVHAVLTAALNREEFAPEAYLQPESEKSSSPSPKEGPTSI